MSIQQSAWTALEAAGSAHWCAWNAELTKPVALSDSPNNHLSRLVYARMAAPARRYLVRVQGHASKGLARKTLRGGVHRPG